MTQATTCDTTFYWSAIVNKAPSGTVCELIELE